MTKDPPQSEFAHSAATLPPLAVRTNSRPNQVAKSRRISRFATPYDVRSSGRVQDSLKLGWNLGLPLGSMETLASVVARIAGPDVVGVSGNETYPADCLGLLGGYGIDR